MSILERTDNLIDLYVYAQGVSKIPRVYHMWSFISLVAGCLQDRVWLEEVRDQPLYPNLYIVLWGESGGGKSVAIRSAFNLVVNDDAMREFINAQHGRCTFQSIADMMGRTGRKNEMGLPEYEQPKLWWTMDELANDVGDGARANDFIKGVTELYYCPPRWRDQSRTYGVVELVKPVFNWLAGSTPEWYSKTVKRDGVDGGFQPRVITVKGTVSSDPGASRTWPPIYPKDRDEVLDVVKKRLKWLCRLPILKGQGQDMFVSKSGTGEFTLHEEVRDKLAEWSMNRRDPAEGLAAYWNQEEAKLKKLMMVLSVSERSDLYILPRHWIRARKMLDQVHASVPEVIRANTQTAQSEMVDTVQRAIMKRGVMKHADLLRAVVNRGYKALDVRVARQQLNELGLIDFLVWRGDKDSNGVPVLDYLDPGLVDKTRSGLWYRWTGPRTAVEWEEWEAGRFGSAGKHVEG